MLSTDFIIEFFDEVSNVPPSHIPIFLRIVLMILLNVLTSSHA